MFAGSQQQPAIGNSRRRHTQDVAIEAVGMQQLKLVTSSDDERFAEFIQTEDASV
jgi:hypothetical protein